MIWFSSTSQKVLFQLFQRDITILVVSTCFKHVFLCLPLTWGKLSNLTYFFSKVGFSNHHLEELWDEASTLKDVGINGLTDPLGTDAARLPCGEDCVGVASQPNLKLPNDP